MTSDILGISQVMEIDNLTVNTKKLLAENKALKGNQQITKTVRRIQRKAKPHK